MLVLGNFLSSLPLRDRRILSNTAIVFGICAVTTTVLGIMFQDDSILFYGAMIATIGIPALYYNLATCKLFETSEPHEQQLPQFRERLLSDDEVRSVTTNIRSSPGIN